MLTMTSLRCSPEGQTKRGQPVPLVHVDYTTKSGAERLDALVPKEDAERLKKTPFAAIQVKSCLICMLHLEEYHCISFMSPSRPRTGPAFPKPYPQALHHLSLGASARTCRVGTGP